MRHRLLVSFAIAIVGLAAFSGCASTNNTAGKGRQALVCPQCKMVEVTINRTYLDEARGYSKPYKVGYKDTCPGCEGIFQTFFREGKWKHKCSVCQELPFTCPVFHPTSH